jgi:hypothetical protein
MAEMGGVLGRGVDCRCAVLDVGLSLDGEGDGGDGLHVGASRGGCVSMFWGFAIGMWV